LKKNNLARALRRPGVSYKEVSGEDANSLSAEEVRSIETEIKYEGYIRRQVGEIARLDKIERIRIPDGIDYKNINGISAEIKEKLEKIRPVNLGQASRISGVTPAAVSILIVYLEKTRRKRECSSTMTTTHTSGRNTDARSTG
ncbi:MAG: tRNA uridine-5-carboxymethylaminomethyl(34) synthesis enzyme MnmG, partial [Candidatus Omnitrophica bacterium]|nr:tRNA uridine-5-carboxymethylaminomethyl(34) synthesis enzyme MnmG [Candidatus Omnitrophota bacterium]